MCSSLFCCHGGGGVEDEFKVMDTGLGLFESKASLEGISQNTHLGSSSEYNVTSSVVVYGVSQPSMLLKFIGGIEMAGGFDGSGEWRLCFSSSCISAIVFNTLKVWGGRLRSLRLGGSIGCWFPNPYGIVGSLNSGSIVTICGSGLSNLAVTAICQT